MDFDTLYQHYRTTGNPVPLVAAAPKDGSWGHTTIPQRRDLLPQGEALLSTLKAAFAGQPLHGKYEWADWGTLPR